jgi:DNA helicase II / ATP-dependent DNA helicase PcrA
MPSANRVILACAGSGKTTTIVDDACTDASRKAALITYTVNGTDELVKIACERHRAVPSHTVISTWYAFLLRHFIRPYQTQLYKPRVSRLLFLRGQTARFANATNVGQHYFSGPGMIYLDKVSKFACEIIQQTGGQPIRRFEQIFDRLFIDESQDLSGYDLELVEHLLKSGTEITLVGDNRQATYTTNDSGKNKRYARSNIVDKFKEWERAKLCSIEYQTGSRRCVQQICDFADLFFPAAEKTQSLNSRLTGHDGIFAVEKRHVADYSAKFDPQPLRYNRTYSDIAGRPINFGVAKGMTFERTLIYPHGPLRKYLGTGKLADAGKELPKLYVAVTRARQSTAFVVEDGATLATVARYQP